MVCMKYVIVLLAVAGIYVSSRALQVHYLPPGAALPCAVTATWDCGQVNQGNYSVFPPKSIEEYDENGIYHPAKLHVPVALIGIVGYAVILVAALAGRLRIVLELARVGFFCAAFLSYIEAYIITKWCIYCVWSQCIIAAILLLSIIAVLLRRRRRAESMVSVLAVED